jgi:hypothetical protein
MARRRAQTEIESGVTVLKLRKGGKTMAAVTLKRKLRGFPTGNLSLRISAS